MNEYEFKEEGLKYQKILKLEGERIEFFYDRRGGRTTRNANNTYWEIYGFNSFDIIHELGHILFDPNYNHYIYNITNSPIFRIINNVYDSFINYGLVINPNVPEYAKVLYRGCLDIKINIAPNLSKFDGYKILGFYCLLYLSLNYVLPDRESFTSKKWPAFLEKLKKKIKNDLQIAENFTLFENKLDNFKENRETSDFSTIANYILSIVQSLDIGHIKASKDLIKKILL